MSGIERGGAPGLDYSDFEIEISAGDGREYPVTVHSPEGERRATMRFPFGQGELRERLKDIQIAVLRSSGLRRRVQSPEDRSVQDFGEALFEAVFAGDVRSAFDLSRRRAQQDGNGLRVRLRVDDPALAALPWELLYDPREAEFLSLSRATPIVRFPAVPRAMSALPVTLPLRALGMVASPDGLPPLNVERERRRMEEALRPLVEAGGLELEWVPGQTWRDLQRAMQQGPWHVFHFIGHGRFDAGADEGIVSLSGDYGSEHRLRATQLARVLADQESLRLVVLNSCEGATGSSVDVFSGTASVLVRRGIPAVVAMQFEISDVAAVEFARSFYESVARGWPVDAAVTEARKAISFNDPDSVEWGTPVLYLRSQSGRLFEPDRAITTSVTQPTAPAEVDEPTGDMGTPESAPPPRTGSRRGLLVGAALAAVTIAAVAVILLVTRGGAGPPPPSARAIPEGILLTVTDTTAKPEANEISIADPVDGGLAPFADIAGTDPEWVAPGRVAYQPEDGGHLVTVPYFHPNDPDRTRGITVPGDATSFDLAPDGSLAYTTADCVCARGPTGGAVFTLDGLTLPLGVSWSPDGSRIAYLASGAQPGDDPGAFQLWVVDVRATPSPSQRTDETYGLEDYAWGPDGRSIVYSAHNPDTSPIGATDLFRVSVTGAAQRNQLTADPNPDRSPTWSPDGSRIAYVREPPAGTEIRVMTADGNEDALLVPTRVGVSYGSLDWGPPEPAAPGATAGSR